MNEKKEYKTPTAEKVEFDYTESVEACPSGCGDPTHWDHQGYTYGSCGLSAGWGNNNSGGNNSGNNGGGNENGGSNSGGNSYWAVAWGQPCS